MYVHALHTTTLTGERVPLDPTSTSYIFRKMKFLPKSNIMTATQLFSGIPRLEHYIELTKTTLDNQLPEILTKPVPNLTKKEKSSIKSFKKQRKTLTIKPADKNLGIVIMNTDDYLQQCAKLLQDQETYQLSQTYPDHEISRKIRNVLISFKSQLSNYSKKLYNYLEPNPRTQLPRFYGIPKIHKQCDPLPPMRPIVAHNNSLLAPVARFLDHVLQPIAQAYPDYLQNSVALSLQLQNTTVPETAILVSVDVKSLYPSIPQSECLQIVYDELHVHRHLLLLDPNLIIQLLQICVNYNYFEFSGFIFQQTTGTAMGAAFSPTIANIFMSVTLRRFLRTQRHHPLLLKRYIDDILIIWTKPQEDLEKFLNDLNTFHPSLKYTFEYSTENTNFLDLTIYKGPHFQRTKQLDTKTYQKPQNLYQYLHYTSHHQRNVHKAVILGECVRYIRTNTTKDNYIRTVSQFKTRLQARGYPPRFIDTATAIVSYENRQRYLLPSKSDLEKNIKRPPIFKCIAPSQFHHLKEAILKHYSLINEHVNHPRFIALRHKTLSQDLIRAQVFPTDEQMIDLVFQFGASTATHVTAGNLPQLKFRERFIKKCGHPRCSTCQHLQCQTSFTSTKTKISYPIRHHLSCTSSNIVYLITCSKCKKQYVGMTTKQLNTRLNHHRTAIFNKKRTYLHSHFNLPDHSIKNLTIQAIDHIQMENESNVTSELRKLEKFWIKTLKTYQPIGLNVSLST